MTDVVIMKPCLWPHDSPRECPGCKGTGEVRDFRAERIARHVAAGYCPAVIRHGPGRQSESMCERKAHEGGGHQVTVAVWEWDSDEAVVDDFGEVHER